MEYRLRDIIKTHGKGLVRRGCPKGQPAVKFNHSPFLSNGGGLRATNHELQATIFPRAEGGQGDIVPLSLTPRSGI